MRLTLQSDYSLRMLMHLAARPGELTTIASTAALYDISKNHLMKVANILGRDGYIDTVRGRTGGLRLSRAASKINVGAVVRHMEGEISLVECFPGGNDQCLITPACKLKGVLGEAVEAFFKVLDKYTIADLVNGNKQLLELLNVDAA